MATTRERSPNYPGYGLDAAVQMLQALYESEHKVAVSSEVAARALGHAGVSEKGRLSGPALAKLAALRQYGLIESLPQGKLKVSNAALDFVLHDPDSPEYSAAAKKAALSPTIFAELYGDYAKASDNALRAHLIKERKFSEEGAGRLIRAFKDTLAFAKLDGTSYHEHEGGGENVNKPPKPPAGGGITGAGAGQREKPAGANAVAYSWPIGGGNKVDVAFAEEPTQPQLDIMLAQLKIMRDIAPQKKADPPTQTEGGE